MPDLSEAPEALGAGRLLPTETANGAYQMKRDENLLAECSLSLSGHGVPMVFPALRFYRWQPPCLSLGRNQDLDNPRHGRIHEEAARAHGVDIVRRPSGGRAILHFQDLTYALVMPAPSDDITSSHRLIARGLAMGLRALGLNVDDSLTAMPTGRNPADCFAAAAGADLQSAGRKVMGSAQRRAGGALLEHGALYLTSPDPLYAEVFGVPFGDSVAALDELLGHAVDFDAVARALTHGLETALSVRFSPNTP